MTDIKSVAEDVNAVAELAGAVATPGSTVASLAISAEQLSALVANAAHAALAGYVALQPKVESDVGSIALAAIASGNPAPGTPASPAEISGNELSPTTGDIQLSQQVLHDRVSALENNVTTLISAVSDFFSAYHRGADFTAKLTPPAKAE